MIARFFIRLLLTHFWSLIFSAAGTALFFASNRGHDARAMVRGNGTLIHWLFISLGVCGFLMVAQAIGGGSVQTGLGVMWDWLVTKIAALFGRTVEVAKASKSSAKKKTAEK